MRYLILTLILFFMSGCGPMDIRNTVVMSLGKKSANNLSLVGYGYDKNNRYLNQDIGNLNLKRAVGKHKLQADEVKMFLYRVPKNCKEIGYVTIENPNGLKFPDIGGIGKFDTEHYEFKYLRKAAAVSGVKYISFVESWKLPLLKKNGSYDITYSKDVIRVFRQDNDRYLRVSVKAYECGD